MAKKQTSKKPQPRRILMLAWEYPPRIVGGLARHAGELSAALARQGHRVDVITAHTPEAPAIEQLWPKGKKDADGRLVAHRGLPEAINPLDFVCSIHQLNFALLARVFAIEDDFDLVHAHDWLVAQAAWTLKKGKGLPLVATIHATEHGRQQGIHNPLQSYINANEWLLSYEASRVITCSSFMADEVKRVHSTPEDKIRVVPNGIDPDRLRISPKEKKNLAEFRARWAAPKDKVVLFVGRMVREKGAQILVEAMPRVLSIYPHTRFVIAGGGYAGHLESRARWLGVRERLTLTGYISEADLKKLYAVADAAVFPSLYEPFGIVALEAMAAGVPVITSDIGGFKEVVEPGKTGLHTWANNPDSLAWGILEVFAKPEEAAARARRARKGVKARFSWDKVAQETVVVYDEARQVGRPSKRKA